MFDLGFQELIVIFAVAIMVVGPKKLPELSRKLGKGVGQLRKALFDVKYEINKEMRTLDEESGKDSIMEDIPKWKREAMDAIYGGKEPAAGGPKNEAAAMQAGVNKATVTAPEPPSQPEENNAQSEENNVQPDTAVDSDAAAEATQDADEGVDKPEESA